MAGLTPIDFSLLGQQRSDISKVAGDDFLKIQQQQLASVLKDEQELHKEQTTAVDTKDNVEVKADKEGSENQQQEKRKRENNEHGDLDAPEDQYDYVQYDDPDLGKAGEWVG